MLGVLLSILTATWFYFASWTRYFLDTIRRFVASQNSPSAAMVGRPILFDNGRKVVILRQIAEGGFSVVYSAKEGKDAHSLRGDKHSRKSFALKQIICHDSGVTSKCREEADIHRAFHHPNLMPILACKFDRNGRYGEFRGTICYILFPLYESSLRDQITKRNLLSPTASSGVIHPWSEREIVELLTGIVDGVKTMHHQGYAHRDIKLENVLLDSRNKPVLMDFGSAGPLKVPIQSKAALMAAFDDAATNCTMSYRAPELFEGGARYGEVDIDGSVDVWSLGCVLFGMMYGASPFECEFRGESVKIVECSYLRVLGKVPTPINGTELASRYHPDLLAAVNWMLNQDRTERPTIDNVALRVEQLLQQFHGTRSWAKDKKKAAPMDIDLNVADDDEFDSFLQERESLV